MTSRKASWRTRGLTAFVMLVAIGLYIGVPRQADLRSFDPARMAALETAMWRDYYEKRYPALFYNLYESSRADFGFSPLDSLRIAFAAANAARTFQPTRSRDEASAALPSLITYYSVLARAAPVSFDVRKAAELELDWWQARREAVPPEIYGCTIAATSAMVYGSSDDLIVRSGVERAQAMAFRDQRADDITDADWADIERRLTRAYAKLRAGVSR